MKTQKSTRLGEHEAELMTQLTTLMPLHALGERTRCPSLLPRRMLPADMPGTLWAPSRGRRPSLVG